MAGGIVEALLEQFVNIPEYVRDLTGKTVIVVGANIGLGFEAAKKFANMNPERLILACRSQSKGDEAVRFIKKDTGCPNVECWKIDLADFKTVSAFVDKFGKEGGGRLDILLNNAGVLHSRSIMTIDGWENTLQVNHFGGTLLALLLLPVMSKTPNPSRIIFVSSGAHIFVQSVPEVQSKHMLNKLNDPTGMDAKKLIERYNVTKLFNVLFARAFANRLKPSMPVSVDSLDPGYCYSSLRRNAAFPLNILDNLVGFLLARTTEVGARTLVHAALWGSKQDVNGRYLSSSKVKPESDFAHSREGKLVEERLWDETIEVLETLDPRVKNIIAEYF